VAGKLFGVNRICQICGISKATFYRAKEPTERFLGKYEKVKKYVKQIITDHSGYGIRRIKSELKQKCHLEIGRDALGKLLILWGLGLKRKIKKRKISLIKKILIALSSRANLLIRTEIIRPLQGLSSDITELVYQQGKCYLSVHKDIFGQMVYGLSMQETMESKLVVESFQRAIKLIKKMIKTAPEKIIVHQDQGSQYTSYEYVDLVIKNKQTLSYSTPGRPWENPGQESFFGRFKDDWKVELAELKTFKEVKKFVAQKIKYYNRQRIHTNIGYVSPEKYTKKFLKSLKI